MKFKVANIWSHHRSTVLGGIVLAATYALVYPFKVATFEQISPVLLIVVPFLLYGKKPKSIDGQ
jgi:hypothetical protein